MVGNAIPSYTLGYLEQSDITDFTLPGCDGQVAENTGKSSRITIYLTNH
jgi:hypothetical protein